MLLVLYPFTDVASSILKPIRMKRLGCVRKTFFKLTLGWSGFPFTEVLKQQDLQDMERGGPANLPDQMSPTLLLIFPFVLSSVWLIFIRSGYIPTVQDRMSCKAFGVFITSAFVLEPEYNFKPLSHYLTEGHKTFSIVYGTQKEWESSSE